MPRISIVNACELPEPAPARDADVYRSLRDTLINRHCAHKERDHACAGQITITAKHVTFNCKLCGDARQLIEVDP